MIFEATYNNDGIVELLRPELLIKMKRSGDAAERLEEIISKQPENYFAWEKLLLVYLEANDYKRKIAVENIAKHIKVYCYGDSWKKVQDEINQRIDYQINSFTQQYGSVANIEKIYGMSIDRIKRELRDEVRKSLMSQRLQEKNFGKVQASRREVEDFFETYKDSIGNIPEKVKIFHIFQNPKASEKLKKKF